MDGVLTACVWVLVAFALVVVVLALRQPVVAAPQGALASIGVPRAAGPLRDLPVLPRTGGFADRTRPVDLGALRRAVATRIDGRFSASRSAELLRYLRGQPLRPSTDSSAYGVAAYPQAASMLTPAKPLDGAQMQGTTGTLTAGLALGGTALLVALGLL